MCPIADLVPPLAEMDAYRWGYACPQAAYAGNQRRVLLQMLQTDSMTGTSNEDPDDGGRFPTGTAPRPLSDQPLAHKYALLWLS